jgi:hypothetical protein
LSFRRSSDTTVKHTGNRLFLFHCNLRWTVAITVLVITGVGCSTHRIHSPSATQSLAHKPHESYSYELILLYTSGAIGKVHEGG